jgi:hypothetical protein
MYVHRHWFLMDFTVKFHELPTFAAFVHNVCMWVLAMWSEAGAVLCVSLEILQLSRLKLQVQAYIRLNSFC